MSSSSSSDCTCAECVNYGANFIASKRRPPFYQTLGHPLIYYAQMEPQPYSKRNKDSRNPNCFVKAFRWYTQGHVPVTNKQKSNLSEFAAWLDTKYDDFLKSKDRVACQSNVNNVYCEEEKQVTSEQCENCEPLRKKLFARSKGPWTKKQRGVNSKDHRAYTLEQCPQTLEYILAPKDLSRATSDCCPQTCQSNRSKPSATSSETYTSKRTVVVTRNNSEKNISACACIPVEVNKNEGVNIQPSQKPLDTTNAVKKDTSVMSRKLKLSTKDVMCQCSEAKIVKIDAQTQYYDSDGSKISNKSSLPLSRTSETLRMESNQVPTKKESKPTSVTKVKKNSVETECHCEKVFTANAQNQYEEKRINNDSGCCCVASYGLEQTSAFSYLENSLTRMVYPCPMPKTREVVNKEAGRPIVISKNDDSIQTSDHSICLGDKCSCKYPFFMKIVCADKLQHELYRK